MLERFVASNGIVIEHSALIRTVAVLKDGVNTDFVSTLMHQHFDKGTLRCAFGEVDRKTYKALEEFFHSLGITEITRGRKDGSKKEIK